MKLQNHITERHQRPWHQTVGRKFHISEYHLYSLFVIEVQRQNPHHFNDNTIYCKGLWSKEDAKGVDILTFCREIRPPQFVVCLQSRIGLNTHYAQEAFEEAIAAR